MAEHYMGRMDGVLFRDSLPKDDNSWEVFPGLSEEKIVEIANFLAAIHPLEYRALHQAVGKFGIQEIGDTHLLRPLLAIKPLEGLGLAWAKGKKILRRYSVD